MSALVDKTCSACGRPVHVPAATSPALSSFVERLELVCDECTAEREADEERDAELARQVDRIRVGLERAERRERLSSVPKLYRRSLDELDVTDGNRHAVAAARAWLAGGMPRGLVLTGPIGAGKTAIAAAACWDAQIEHVGACVFASVPRMLARTMAGYSSTERADALRIITGDEPIVLDDLDKLNATEWAATQLFAAIDTRVTEGTRLIVTTNLGLDQLAHRLGGEHGPAIASRLVGYCRTLVVNGTDRRLTS